MKSSNVTGVRSSGSARVLVIMAKAPKPGEVKTRLASSLSPAAAVAFYCCLLDDTLTLARSLGDVEVAIMCPDSDVNDLTQLAGSEASVVAQKVTVLPQASHRCSRISQRVINDGPLPSTATAHTCRVLFSKTRSKRWPHRTWSWGQRTTEATISSGQRLLILRFSQATEWAPVAPWRGSCRTHELLSFP